MDLPDVIEKTLTFCFGCVILSAFIICFKTAFKAK